jgi:hypothetical protein
VKDEIDILAAYLAGNELPEGVSLSAVLNNADPKVRHRLGLIFDTMDGLWNGGGTTRTGPFGDQKTVNDLAKLVGIPAEYLERMFTKLNNERIQAKVQARFEKPDEYRRPPEREEKDDRRSAIESAFAAHGG